MLPLQPLGFWRRTARRLMAPQQAALSALKKTKRRRFYKVASVAEGAREGTFEVALDRRTLKSPMQRPLGLPDRVLALAVAAEWDAQKNWIEPSSMPLMSLASTAVDQVTDERDKVIETLLAYLQTDTVTFFSTSDDESELRLQQDALFVPLLEWMSSEYGIELARRSGFEFGKRHPETAAPRAVDLLQTLSPWKLAALQCSTTECKSLTLGLALLARRVDADQAGEASRLEESLQIERWGLVEGQHDYDITRTKIRIGSAALFADLVS